MGRFRDPRHLGIFLTVRAVKLFLFDADWEKEIIEKEMRKSKQSQKF